MNTISIATSKGNNLLSLHNIIRIQSNSNYCKIYFADNSYPLTVAKILHWFEDNLPAGMFLRTHRTHLVNTMHISKVVLSSKVMHLSNGEQIGISKRRKQWVKERVSA
jgi:two-component system, LytTR family, response regulator